MSDLANYSIETDHTVLLSFKDGRRIRVPLGQLPSYLKPADLERVKRAVKLRRDFIRHHMPKSLLVLIGVGLLAMSLFTGSRVVAWLMGQTGAPGAVPEESRMVRDLQVTTPHVSQQPATEGSAAVAPAPPDTRSGLAVGSSGQRSPGKHSMTVSGIVTQILGPVSLPSSTPLPTVIPVGPLETPPLGLPGLLPSMGPTTDIPAVPPVVTPVPVQTPAPEPAGSTPKPPVSD